MDENSDSQASQILANLQDRREPSKTSTASESLNSHATCTDSSSLNKNPRPAARYHFHGLAATQTTHSETQLNSNKDDEHDQDSQKENIHALRLSADQRTLNSAIATRHSSSGSHSLIPNVTKHRAKPVSFQSPARTKLNTPLQSHSTTPSQIASSQPVRSFEHSDSNMFQKPGPHPVMGTVLTESSQLTESESSQNDEESQSLHTNALLADDDEIPGAQPPEDFDIMDIDDLPELPQYSQDSDADQQAFWDAQPKNNVRSAESQPNETQPVETQLSESQPVETQEATQPATQITDPVDEPERVDVPHVCFRAYMRATGIENPMDVTEERRWGILQKNRVDPLPNDVWDGYWKERNITPMAIPMERRWFALLQDFIRVASEVNESIHSLDNYIEPSQDEALSQALQETQLAEEKETSYAPRRILRAPRQVQRATTSSNSNRQNAEDTMDVIPDSEPARGGPALQESRINRNSPRSSCKRKHSPEVDVEVPDSTELQQDSDGDVQDLDDDDSDDIPLRERCAQSVRHARTTTGSTELMPPPYETRSSSSSNSTDTPTTRGSSNKRQRTKCPSPDRDDTPIKAGPSSYSVRKKTPGSSASKTHSNSKKRETSVASSSRGPTRHTFRPDSRVFALWKQDGHYYAGIVKKRCDSGYIVSFCDDTTRTDIAIEHLRAFDLRTGDSVIYGEYGHVATVDRVEEQVIHIITSRNALRKLHFRDIKISSKTIESQWTDRKLTEQMIRTARSSADDWWTSKSLDAISSWDCFLHGCAIITSFSITDRSEHDKNSDQLSSILKLDQGKVLKGWHEVIHLEGKQGYNEQHWYIERKDVYWKGSRDIRRLFLVGDDATQKVKYLFAIAIGVPCLSIEWLEDKARIHEWNRHLLIQGYSDYLHARISQVVDLDWGNSVCHLEDIMDNPVPPKVFTGKSVVCLGDLEKLDLTKNLGIPHIILAMGAERVEHAKTWDKASREKSSCDYIVLLKERLTIGRVHCNCQVVSWNWVKQCLISGRIVPPED